MGSKAHLAAGTREDFGADRCLHTLGAVRAGHELASIKPFLLLWHFLAGFATITAAPSLCINRGNQPVAASMDGFEEIRSHVAVVHMTVGRAMLGA